MPGDVEVIPTEVEGGREGGRDGIKVVNINTHNVYVHMQMWRSQVENIRCVFQSFHYIRNVLSLNFC